MIDSTNEMNEQNYRTERDEYKMNEMSTRLNMKMIGKEWLKK